MSPELPEHEQEFRSKWMGFDPSRYAEYLNRVPEHEQLELLTRILGVELEYSFQPPTVGLSETKRADAGGSEITSDDERVRPCVQLFIIRFPNLLKHTELLLRLIVLEYALRLRYDQTPPNPESYVALCETDQQHISNLLAITETKVQGAIVSRNRDVVVSSGDSTVKDEDTSVSLHLDPFPHSVGCFLLVRMIGRGGMGYVYSAIDLRSAAQVAVKVIRRVDAWSVYRFIEEFNWLARLNHPNLVRLYDVFCDGQRRYYSMELVDGQDIRQWFQHLPSQGQKRWTYLYKALSQLASAISFLHDQGVIHRDIKCSNVLITGRRRAVLLDLGLAGRLSDQRESQMPLDGERLIGTLQYMPPEVLFNQALSYASDWYSFGVMLFETIVNKYPPIQIVPESTEVAARYTINQDAIEQDLKDCPPDLRDLCLGLLKSDPDSRPPAGKILATLGASPSDASTIKTGLSCVGRESEQETLNGLLADLQSGPPTLVELVGDSGLGKSTLINFWLATVNEDPSMIISLQCYGRDHTSLRLLNLLVHELVRRLQSVSKEIWEKPLAKFAEEISFSFPQIRQLFGEKLLASSKLTSGTLSQTPADTTESQTKSVEQSDSLRALAHFLSSLSQHRPFILCIDDIQCADETSLNMLRSDLLNLTDFRGIIVFSRETTANQPATRDTKVITDSPIPSKYRSIKLQLKSLDPTSIDRLIEEVCRESNIEITEAERSIIHRKSEGNPFLIKELIQTWFMTGGRSKSEGEGNNNAKLPSEIHQRFSQLPIHAENVLQFLAVADRAVGFHQLQMVSRHRPQELMRIINQLESQRWIRSRDALLDSTIEIAQPSFRRLVLESLPGDRLQRRHFRWAKVLSSDVPPPWERIANHYWHAEQYPQAATCFMEASIACAAKGDFELALTHLVNASHESAERTAQEHRNALVLKAKCLAAIGRVSDASSTYEALCDQANDCDERHLYRALAGESNLRAGFFSKGLSDINEVMSQIIKPGRLMGQILNQLPYYRLLRHSQWITIVRHTEDKHTKETSSNRRNVLSHLTESLTKSSLLLAFLGLENELDLAIRRPDSFIHSQQTRDYLSLALAFRQGNWPRETQIRAIKSLRQQSRGTHSPKKKLRPVLQSEGFRNAVHLVARMDRGINNYAERYGAKALEVFSKSGDDCYSITLLVQSHLLQAHWNGNRLGRLLQDAKALRESVDGSQDFFAKLVTASVPSVRADLVGDQAGVAEDRVDASIRCIADDATFTTPIALSLSKATLYLYNGQHGEAIELLRGLLSEPSWRKVFNQRQFFMNKSIRVQLKSLAMCCELVKHRNNALSGSTLSNAKRHAQALRKMREPAHRAIGDAFSLVIESHRSGTISNPSLWDQTRTKLNRSGAHLLSSCFDWQRCFSLDSEQLRKEEQERMRNTFLAQGCVAPEKLLDIILPLPFPRS